MWAFSNFSICGMIDRMNWSISLSTVGSQMPRSLWASIHLWSIPASRSRGSLVLGFDLVLFLLVVVLVVSCLSCPCAISLVIVFILCWVPFDYLSKDDPWAKLPSYLSQFIRPSHLNIFIQCTFCTKTGGHMTIFNHSCHCLQLITTNFLNTAKISKPQTEYYDFKGWKLNIWSSIPKTLRILGNL